MSKNTTDSFKNSLKKYMINPNDETNKGLLVKSSAEIYLSSSGQTNNEPDKYMIIIDNTVKPLVQEILSEPKLLIAPELNKTLEGFIRQLGRDQDEQGSRAFHALTLAYYEYLKEPLTQIETNYNNAIKVEFERLAKEYESLRWYKKILFPSALVSLLKKDDYISGNSTPLLSRVTEAFNKSWFFQRWFFKRWGFERFLAEPISSTNPTNLSNTSPICFSPKWEVVPLSNDDQPKQGNPYSKREVGDDDDPHHGGFSP
jgi:hypothetical protein